MADPKKDQKTEAPTPRRKKQLRSEGRIARSPDIGSAIALGGLYVITRYLLPSMGRRLGDLSSSLLSTPGRLPTRDLLLDTIVPAALAVLLPPLGVALFLAIAAGVGQTRGVISPKALRPKWSRLSPKQGLDKFKPSTMAFETFRVILKTALLVAVLWIPVQGIIGRAPAGRNLGTWTRFIGNSINTVLMWSAILATIIAAVDYAQKFRKLSKESKMTRQELREEAKESDGDPIIKRARRERARELSRNRMIADVASADVLLINPIRFAVALKYVEAEGAPRVVARGAGTFAQQLRREAYRHGVTVKQDIPLTRALYRRCKVGQFVPAELYEAVAVVLAAVYRRRSMRAMNSMRRVAA
jgi:flagellar biosynthetic protein FlhB